MEARDNSISNSLLVSARCRMAIGDKDVGIVNVEIVGVAVIKIV